MSDVREDRRSARAPGIRPPPQAPGPFPSRHPWSPDTPGVGARCGVEATSGAPPAGGAPFSWRAAEGPRGKHPASRSRMPYLQGDRSSSTPPYCCGVRGRAASRPRPLCVRTSGRATRPRPRDLGWESGGAGLEIRQWSSSVKEVDSEKRRSGSGAGYLGGSVRNSIEGLGFSHCADGGVRAESTQVAGRFEMQGSAPEG